MIKPLLYLSILTGGMLVISAGPVGEPAATDTDAEYELRIGKKSFDVALDRPFEITTPKGERLKAVLRRKRVVHYSGHGVSFDYHNEMRVSVEKKPTHVVITIEGTDTPVINIVVYDVEIELQEALDGMIAAFQKMGLKVHQRSVNRTIGGVDRRGVSMRGKLGGFPWRVDTFAFKKAGKVMSVTCQYSQDESKLAGKQFKTILESLK